jgi:hypothetical protein
MTYVTEQNFSVQICKSKCLFSDIFFLHSRTVPVTYYNKAILSNLFPFCDIYTTKKKKPDKKMHASAWQSKHLRTAQHHPKQPEAKKTIFTHRSVFIILLCANISHTVLQAGKIHKTKIHKVNNKRSGKQCHHQ